MTNIFYFLYVFLGLVFAGVSPLSIEDTITRCTESCLKIHPYDNITHSHPPENALVKHCAKLTSDGKCECDWEKILTPEGNCECHNPYHSINPSNECVCDVTKCPAPSEHMFKCTESEKLLEGCCPVYECNDCPDDSYRNNNTHDDKCVCYPCKLNDCKNNQSMIIIRKGNQKPGTCCDLYQCDDVIQIDRKNCSIDNQNHSDGESWQNGCTVYNCKNGIVFQKQLENCEKTFCFSNDKIYQNNQTWMEDECTNCTCLNGEKKCMAHFCKDLPSATIRPSEECLPMELCNKECPFGYKHNRKGCEICKCRPPDAKTVQDILRVVNCTSEHCNVLQVTSICVERNAMVVENCPKCPDPSSSELWPSILLTLALSLALICGVLIWLLCRERRRALCSLHRSHAAQHTTDKYHHIPMYDNNLNQDNKAAMLLSAGKTEKEFR